MTDQANRSLYLDGLELQSKPSCGGFRLLTEDRMHSIARVLPLRVTEPSEPLWGFVPRAVVLGSAPGENVPDQRQLAWRLRLGNRRRRKESEQEGEDHAEIALHGPH